MRKQNEASKSHSLKTLFFYGAVVFLLIIISAAIRIYSIVATSKFDGQHRFTLAIGEGNKAYGFISFEPQTSSLSILTFANNLHVDFTTLNRVVGVIPDGYFKTFYPLDLRGTVPSILSSFLFNWNNSSHNITIYDSLQLWLYANKISGSTVSVVRLAALTEANAFNKTVSLLFTDDAISDENISIKIINATGQSGLGSRLERVISNLGGNVVSVETAVSQEPISKIQYLGHETYTLRKLNSLLRYRQEALADKSIAQIIIIIGNDKRQTKLF